MLECEFRTGYKMFYIGYTFSLKERMKQHKKGIGAVATRNARKVTLVWYKKFIGTIGDGMREEKYYKKFTKQEKLKLVENFPEKFKKVIKCEY